MCQQRTGLRGALMAEHTNSVELLFLTVRAAAERLGCSREELLAWIEPDRHLPENSSGLPGARLWRLTTLDAAKPHVKDWRARDRAADEAALAKQKAKQESAKARRKGMRKGGAVTAKAARERLGCSATELDRWSADGRLPPDGEIVMIGLPKIVNARAWLPATIDAAKTQVADWRTQDKIRRAAKRKPLRIAQG